MTKDIMLNEVRRMEDGTEIRARQTCGGCEGCDGCGKKLFPYLDELGACDPDERADGHNVIFEIFE